MNTITELKKHQKFNTLPFHIERFCRTSPIQLHYHDCTELIFCTRGLALNHIDDICIELGKGSLFIIGGRQTHTMSDFKNFEGYRILFDFSLLDPLAEETKNTTGYTSLFLLSDSGYIRNDFKSCVHISQSFFDRLVPLMEELLTEYESSDFYTENYIKNLFLSVCTLIIKSYENALIKGTKTIYNEVVSFLFKSLDEENSIAGIAKSFGVSERYFRKIFTEHTGLSPSQFIVMLRLRKAKSMLSCTDESVTAIAYSCGFYDSCHLTRIFKKYEGMTPREYRQKTRQ